MLVLGPVLVSRAVSPPQSFARLTFLGRFLTVKGASDSQINVRPSALLFVLFFAGLFGCSDNGGAALPNPSDTGFAQSVDAVSFAPDAEIEADAGVLDASIDASSGTPDASADAGGSSNPLCLFGGFMTQGQGQECGCGEDCRPSAPRCARNLVVDLTGPSYCTTGCTDSPMCEPGFACFDNFGIGEPFCQRCETNVPGSIDIDESCICDEDCGTAQVGGSDRDLTCRNSLCSVVGCIPFTVLGCPDGYFCELQGIEPICQRCQNQAPAAENGSCGCQTDCESGLVCREGACRRPCQTDQDCGPNTVCNNELIGESLCAPSPPGCTQTRTSSIGEVCVCNSDCAPSAPTCTRLTFTGSASVGICTVRPCDRADPMACPGTGFSCCEVPLILAPTCLDSRLTDPLGAILTCGP